MVESWFWFNGRKNQKTKIMTTAYLSNVIPKQNRQILLFEKLFFSFWKIWDETQNILASFFKGIKLYMMCLSYTFSEQMGSNQL